MFLINSNPLSELQVQIKSHKNLAFGCARYVCRYLARIAGYGNHTHRLKQIVDVLVNGAQYVSVSASF